MDDLIITLFMADTGITDEALAESLLLRFGLAEHYLPFAAKLLPFVEAESKAAALDGAVVLHDAIVSMRFDPSVIPNEEFGKGVEFAMDIVHNVVDRIIMIMDETPNEPVYEDTLSVAPSR